MQRILQSLKVLGPYVSQSFSANVVSQRIVPYGTATFVTHQHEVLEDQQRRLLSLTRRNYNTTGQPLPSLDIEAEKLVKVSAQNEMCVLLWDDGHSSKYPFVWLRDNCRCSTCYHPSSNQRLMKMIDLDPDVKAKENEVSSDGSNLNITWPDNHISEYPSAWLRKHQFNMVKFDPISHIVQKPWSIELSGNVPTFNYDDIMTNDESLFDWLSGLYTTGLTVLNGGPDKPGAVQAIGNRVAYLRNTVFGKVFQVYAKSDAKNLAYTNDALELHVDLPSHGYVPGIQMLHCIIQTDLEGGQSLFADGYKIWLQIKEENPEMYHILSTVNIHHRNCSCDDIKDIHTMQGKPVFELDDNGHFQGVHYNNVSRAPFIDTSVENVQEIYRAFKLLYDKSCENAINFKLKTGDIVVFNNTRIMHGRSRFEVHGSSNRQAERHLEGAYLDWDEVHSKMRVLYEKFHGVLGL